MHKETVQQSPSASMARLASKPRTACCKSRAAVTVQVNHHPPRQRSTIERACRYRQGRGCRARLSAREGAPGLSHQRAPRTEEARSPKKRCFLLFLSLCFFPFASDAPLGHEDVAVFRIGGGHNVTGTSWLAYQASSPFTSDRLITNYTVHNNSPCIVHAESVTYGS